MSRLSRGVEGEKGGATKGDVVKKRKRMDLPDDDEAEGEGEGTTYKNYGGRGRGGTERGSTDRQTGSRNRKTEDRPRKATTKYSGHFGAGDKRAGDGKPIHKQEARLRKWQQNRREKVKSGDLVPSFQNKKRERASKNATDEGSQAREGTPRHNPKKQRTDRDKEGSRDRAKTPSDRQRSAAQEGGLSASLTTEKTIAKNKGAIAAGAPQGKKITFGDDD